jgi:hypothetical protein
MKGLLAGEGADSKSCKSTSLSASFKRHRGANNCVLQWVLSFMAIDLLTIGFRVLYTSPGSTKQV